MDGELQRKHGALSELPAVRSEPRPLSTEERQQKQAELNALQPEHCRAPLHRQKQTRRDRAQLRRQLKSGLSRRGRAPRPLSAEERQQIQAELNALQPERRQTARRARQNLARQLKSGLTRGRAPRPLSAEERQQKQAELDALQPDGPLRRQARKRRRVDRPKNRLVEGRTSHTRTARPGPLSVEGQQQARRELVYLTRGLPPDPARPYTLEDHEWRQAIRAWSHEDAAKEANPCH